MKIYLASPLGFAACTKGFLEELKSELRAHGHAVVDPWEEGEELFEEYAARTKDATPDTKARELHRLNHRIGEGNRVSIEAADAVVAVLDGPDVDSGTASEIGYAYARGKRIVGYRGDIRLTGENAATVVNLQVQYWIEDSGRGRGRIVKAVPGVIEALESVRPRAPPM